jgi:hypothetical protein
VLVVFELVVLGLVDILRDDFNGLLLPLSIEVFIDTGGISRKFSL